MTNWKIFAGSRVPHDGLRELSFPPPWRRSSVQEKPEKPAAPPFDLEAERDRGEPILLGEEVQRAVNASLFLRRPLLITGKPGVGKSSVISAVAYELRMGPVLRWPITSRSTVKNGLYEYDAIGRLQAQQANDPTSELGDFLRLGPLGTALYETSWPRALLIDEIDKGDLDLPNDLLNLVEEGEFEIPELMRAKDEVVSVRLHASEHKVQIRKGRVTCKQFPFIAMTSNGEREFPAPFLRRCIRITIPPPTREDLSHIVRAHLDRYLNDQTRSQVNTLIDDFLKRQETQELATDQLLNAVFVVFGDGRQQMDPDEYSKTVSLLLKQLTTLQATS
jgi:MoxR-like ATPase